MAPSQDAVTAVATKAVTHETESLRRWEGSRAGGLAPDLEAVEAATTSAGRLTLNFHPDRIARSENTVAAGLADTGEYLSQWRTGISNGGRSAFPGGDRQRWEHELFNGAYTGANPGAIALPIYGAWDLLGDPHGGSPRFGSCYLVLNDRVRQRTTMCLGDSHTGPSDVGTFDSPWSVLAGLAEEADSGAVLSLPCDAAALLELLAGAFPIGPARRELDNYVEIQVHGGVDLGADVDLAVLDPSFRGTAIHDSFETMASTYGVELEWHGGSELTVDDVPADFRGPTMLELAKKVARPNGVVDAHAIGVAARSMAFTEMEASGDAQASDAQQLKYLWHTLLAWGTDAPLQLGVEELGRLPRR